MSHNVFLYGSLMFTPVYQGVTGRLRHFEAALIRGYRRYSLRDKSLPYPAVIPDSNGIVRGKLVRGAGDEELRMLDLFEEVSRGLYSRVTVKVETPSETCDAFVYIAGDSLMTQVRGEWDPERFEREYLTHYIRDVVTPFMGHSR